ncbi:hypothetical protein GCM10023148_06580 [Actinokineospora soli]
MTEHARGLARRLVAVTRGGSAPGFDAPLDLLGGPDERTRLRAVLRELVHATASMLLKRGTTGTDQTYLLDLHDTAGKPVAVDELAPPVRALVRAVLADLNGHPADADAQLDLSVPPDGGDPISVLVLALLWTVGALEWCEANDAAPPDWLAKTA